MDRDFKVLFEWVRKEGWNPGLYDFKSYYLVDPCGFKMLWYKGSPIAALASIKYSTRFGFLGLYIVAPEYRGNGYGKYLWNAAMNKVAHCESVGLNAVVKQVSNYEKYDFQSCYKVYRWQAKISDMVIEKKQISESYTCPQNILANEVAELDYNVSGYYRPQFWASILVAPGSFYLGVKCNNQLVGFGMILKCVNGYKIAPLYCSSFNVAEYILHTLLGRVRASGIYKDYKVQLDSISINDKSTLLAEKYGFIKQFDFVRMYRGYEPKLDKDLLYGINSLEIG